MKNWIRLFPAAILLTLTINCHAQWIPAAGMEGAPCNQLYLVDSVLVTSSTPPGIATRHVDSLSWLPYDHMDMMGYTIAGQCIATHLYSTLYRSFDYGETWDTIDLATLSYPVYLTGIDSTLFFYDPGYNIVRSRDYGSSWESITSPSPQAMELYIFSHDSSLFCLDYPATAIFESTDHGNNWTAIPLTGLPPDFSMYVDICRYGGTWWAISTNGTPGIYKFSVANNSWTCMNDTLVFDHFAVLTSVLYGYGTGIWQLNSNWNAWTPLSDGLEGLRVTGLVNLGDHYYCATTEGPYFTVGSFEWEPFMTGLYGGTVHCISAHGSEVWVCFNSSLYRSTDSGSTFEKATTPQNYPNKILITDSLYYLKDGSFYISYDHGGSWIEKTVGLPSFFSWQIHDFSVGNQYIYLALDHQLYRTTTDPLYWEMAPIRPINNLDYLQAQESTLLMGGGGSSSTSYPVKISYDNASSIDTLTFISAASLIFFKIDYNRLYVFKYDGLFYSVDQGYNWDTVPMNIYDFNLESVSQNEEAIFCSGYGYGMKSCNLTPKIFISHDEGKSWISLVENLEDCGSTSLGPVQILGNRVFLGSNANGLWYRDDLLTGTIPRIPAGQPGMQIFPNPAKSSFSIQIESLKEHVTGTVTIRSQTGQIVVRQENINFESGKTTHPIDISNIGPGLYLVSFFSETGAPLYGKLLKP